MNFKNCTGIIGICLIMAMLLLAACSKTGAGKNADGSTTGGSDVRGTADDDKASGAGDAAGSESSDTAQSQSGKTTAPGDGETKEAAWTSDASGDVVGTVDPVEWHEKYYRMAEDAFFDAIGVDKEKCENEQGENSNLYTLPGLYMVYGQPGRIQICTMYGEVRNLSFEFMYDDGLEVPFKLCKSVIKTMDGLYERQGEAATNYLDVSESAEELKKVYLNDLNIGGMAWFVDDDEWVILELRNSGDDTYVAVIYKFNNAGYDGVMRYGSAYDPTTGAPLSEITSIKYHEYSDKFQLQFFYEGTEYQFDIDKSSQRQMGDQTVYESVMEYDENFNCYVLLVMSEDETDMYAGLVRMLPKDTTKDYNENDIPAPFGYIIADSPQTIKNALDELAAELESETKNNEDAQ